MTVTVTGGGAGCGIGQTVGAGIEGHPAAYLVVVKVTVVVSPNLVTVVVAPNSVVVTVAVTVTVAIGLTSPPPAEEVTSGSREGRPLVAEEKSVKKRSVVAKPGSADGKASVDNGSGASVGSGKSPVVNGTGARVGASSDSGGGAIRVGPSSPGIKVLISGIACLLTTGRRRPCKAI